MNCCAVKPIVTMLCCVFLTTHASYQQLSRRASAHSLDAVIVDMDELELEREQDKCLQALKTALDADNINIDDETKECLICFNDINFERPSAIVQACSRESLAQHHVCVQCFNQGFQNGQLGHKKSLCPQCRRPYKASILDLAKVDPAINVVLSNALQQQYSINKKNYLARQERENVPAQFVINTYTKILLTGASGVLIFGALLGSISLWQ